MKIIKNKDCIPEYKQYFDEVAQQWDKMRKSFFSETLRDKVFSTASIQKGKTAADIGAGTGFITEGLIRNGLKVIAADHSEAMLEEMRKKFSSVKGINYHLGEAEKLPIPDGTVDYAFANMYLHHVEFPLKAIKEMVRILKPGGKLIITDLDEHTHKFLRGEHHDRWLGFKREDIRQWFQEAGLKNVIVDCAGESCCAQSSRGSKNAFISIFIASGER